MNRELRRTVIAGNWKMNMMASGVATYADELFPLIPDYQKWCETVICAPYPLLPAAMRVFVGGGISVGAQNMSQFESGAYTGEVSGAQLADLGIKYVIIGHSERRELYGETDSSVNAKVHAALKTALCPIICVGESLKQREIGVTGDIVSMQVKAALYEIPAEMLQNIVIAYEPIWAIGTGKTATPGDAQEVCGQIRRVLSALYGGQIAQTVPILYGGSMNEKNAHDLLAQPDIDGGLIGGASLKPGAFSVIVNAANQ